LSFRFGTRAEQIDFFVFLHDRFEVGFFFFLEVFLAVVEQFYFGGFVFGDIVMVQKSAVVGNDVKEIVVINQAGCGTEADDFEQDFEREFLHSIGFDNVVLARMAVEIL